MDEDAITIHLSSPTPHSPFRSGQDLTGTITCSTPASNLPKEVLVRGYLESITVGRIAGVRQDVKLKVEKKTHKGEFGSDKDGEEWKGEKEDRQVVDGWKGHHQQHRHTLTTYFDTTTLSLSTDASSPSTFTLRLPSSTIKFDHPSTKDVEETYPAPPSSQDSSAGMIKWGVEVLAKEEQDGKTLGRVKFAFMPILEVARTVGEVKGWVGEDEGVNLTEATEEQQENEPLEKTLEKRLRLTSNFAMPWGHLNASVHLPPPHSYSRLTPSLTFSLFLSQEPSKNPLTKKHEARIYGSVATLVMRTWMRDGGGKKRKVDRDVRTQTIPLTIDLVPGAEPRQYDLILDLQSPASGNTPTKDLIPSFWTPNLAREYILRITINPAQNHHTEIGEVPILLLPGDEESERLPAGKTFQEWEGGMERFREAKVGGGAVDSDR